MEIPVNNNKPLIGVWVLKIPDDIDNENILTEPYNSTNKLHNSQYMQNMWADIYMFYSRR